MSKFDYDMSRELTDFTFTALIMGAMRKADSANIKKLRNAFPNIHAELQERYNTPGGYVKEEMDEVYNRDKP